MREELVPFLALGFAIRFIPKRVTSSALFFPVVVFLLLVGPLFAIGKDSSRRRSKRSLAIRREYVSG